ncbi:putative porin [Flagellimonas allohymeniacidonis]|uniref:Porin n=1 Tax=Flagellimonas allohymeniacidonis TaxID=2517819 RepID=A0A4Q8QIC8_9FLAO|nr:putative porin [Allomuricauda hymeniacidonis]TAI48159.1 hypothetical protein EW142_16065 [Allomuricauda hymeniacidonis]
MRFLFLIFLLFSFLPSHAQEDSIAKPKQGDSIRQIPPQFREQNNKDENEDQITIRDYKIISYARDTTFLDTTLTIQKEYKYNFLRKDDFEQMPFSNVGRPYNSLGVYFSNRKFYPRLGALARNSNYFEIEDIYYYNVATPMSDLMFKTTLEQGQLLDALVAFNITPRLNIALAFKGFRSLGKYRFDQVSSGNFRASFNYQTKNDLYAVRGHFAGQDLESEENGGLLNREQFEGGTEDFTDRFRIDVRYTNANNRIQGKRYYFDQQLKLLGRKRDSIAKLTSLALNHEFAYETKFYQFIQTNAEPAFGQNPLETPIDDRARLKTMFNRVSLDFSNPTLGKVNFGASHYRYDYFFNSILQTDEGTISNQLDGDEISVGGSYHKKFGRLTLDADINYNLSGDLTGNMLNASARYQLNNHIAIFGGVHVSSRAPNFNYLLYQSGYRNFNWQNDQIFQKEQIQTIKFGIDSKYLGRLEAEYSALDNYTYFASTITQDQIDAGELETAFVRPFQEGGTINHLRVKYFKEFKWRKWALANTLLYQDVTQDNQVLNVPQFVTRNTFYFSSDVFKKAMFIQTGVTFKYFTSYNMNAYHPLLGEFYLQNGEEFGAFPMLDFFINAKVRQTRIYLKAEHFNSSFSEPVFYSAPNYPYRDFVIRFGLVWNFFS